MYNYYYYYRAAMNAGRCREKGVCPSVRPSVKRMNCDKKEENMYRFYTIYERAFSLVF